MLLEYPGDSAFRPAVQPEEMALVAAAAAPGRPLRPVIVSHSHPNGGREAPHDLLNLVDRMEAAQALPSGAGAAILLGVTQDDEATDHALVDDGVDPDDAARWLAAAIGTVVQNLEPRFEERLVIDSLGRESRLGHAIDPVEADIARMVPADVAQMLAAIPLRREDGKVVVAVADPFAAGLMDELRRHIDDPVRLVIATRPQVQRALGRAGGRRLLGEMLIGWGLSSEEVKTALLLQTAEGIRLGQAVVALGNMTELDLADLVAEQLRIPLIDAEPESLDAEVVGRLPELLCREHQLVPIAEDAHGLLVAMADPSDPDALAAIAYAYEGEVHRAVTTPRSVTRVLSHFHSDLYREMITDQLLTLSPEDSARRVVTFNQKIAFAAIAVLITAGLFMNWFWTLIVLNALATTFYVVSNVVKLWLMNRAIHRSPEIKVTDEEISELDAEDLPIFTILVPMYREANVLPFLVDGMTRLDYSPSKLDVKLLLEPDDEEMLAAVANLTLPNYMEVLVVPDGQPKGKPKACNFGLLHARGEYTVIYDAEDRPESDQLKKVVVAFQDSPQDVICVQAKLNYFNRRQNILTRWFTAEYSLWFDLFLPSLYDLGALASQGNIAMAGSYAVVRSLTTTIENQTANGTAVPGKAVSLASLGRDDIEIASVGDHSSTVTFIAPPIDRSGFGFLNLVISHSALLSNGNSAVTALVNGNRVGTVLLDAANEQDAPLQFRFSGLLLRPGVNTLTLGSGVAVVGAANSCILPNDDQLWVSFSRGSTLQLPGRAAPGIPALETLPYPFLDAPEQGPARMVLVDDSEPVIAAAAGTLAALGSRAVNTPGVLDVVFLKDLKDASGGDHNLIIIGVSGADARLAGVGRRLRVQVSPGSIQVRSPSLGIDGQLLNEGSLGVIEELPVPGSNGHSALWVNATRPEMLPVTVRALYDRGLNGVVVTVDQAGRTRSFMVPGAPVATPEAFEARIVRVILLGLALTGLGLVAFQILPPREGGGP